MNDLNALTKSQLIERINKLEQVISLLVEQAEPHKRIAQAFEQFIANTVIPEAEKSNSITEKITQLSSSLFEADSKVSENLRKLYSDSEQKQAVAMPEGEKDPDEGMSFDDPNDQDDEDMSFDDPDDQDDEGMSFDDPDDQDDEGMSFDDPDDQDDDVGDEGEDIDFSSFNL